MKKYLLFLPIFFLAIFLLSGCADKNVEQDSEKPSITTAALTSNEPAIQDNSEISVIKRETKEELMEETLVKQQIEKNELIIDSGDENEKSVWNIKLDYQKDKDKMDEEYDAILNERKKEDEETKKKEEELAVQRAQEDKERELAYEAEQAAAQLEDDKIAYKYAIERLEEDYNSDLAKLENEEASDPRMQDIANRGMTFSSEANAIKDEYEARYEYLERKYNSDLKAIEATKYW